MGDYKLKTAMDFVVSDGVSTQRKRKELLLLRQRVCSRTVHVIIFTVLS